MTVHPINQPPPPASAKWSVPLVDATRWFEAEPPARRFVVDGWLARGTGALLVGEDGVGKSLVAQQLATCVATGRPFLGLEVTQSAALYLTCEDDEDELWRRQRAINQALGLPINAAPAMLSSLVGWTSVELGHYDVNDKFQLSPIAEGIVACAKERSAGLIILDNLAHLFPGNENVRRDVATFCAAMERMAIDADATVLLLAHPSKSGAEYSGSTGWSAHVRQRWFFDRADKDGAVIDRDARVLRKSKANYAASGAEVHCRWHEWAFIAGDADQGGIGAEHAADAAANMDDDLFLACLTERNRQQRPVSERPSPTYAPTEFTKMPESKRIGKPRLAAAMDRLFRANRIERREVGKGPDRKPIFGICEVAVNYTSNTAKPLKSFAGNAAGNTLRETRETPTNPLKLLAGNAGEKHSISKDISGAAHEAAAPDDDDVIWDADE